MNRAADRVLESIVVIAKEPLAGKVKTRLIGTVSADQAAALAAAALTDTLRALATVPCRNRILLFDGCPTQWLPPGWTLIEQTSGELDQRLAAGFSLLPDGPAVLVGMDTPQVVPAHLEFDHTRFDACLGLADDGGYWAIGFREPARAAEVILGVPMSRSDTGSVQHDRLRAAGMSVQLLAELVDVDTAEDAHRVARDAPETVFAQQWQLIASDSLLAQR